MKFVKKSVCDGGYYNGYGAYKGNAAEQGVKRRKPFATIGCNGYHGPHSCQNHGGIVQGIQPGNAGCVMVADYSQSQAGKKKKQ
jgi:hypothetical protein